MPRRSPTQRKVDRDRIVSMMLAGKTATDIAPLIDVSIKVVCNEINRIEAEWRAQRLEEIDFYRTKELKHLAFLYCEALTGWERSMKEKERKRQRITRKGAVIEGQQQATETQGEVTKELPVGDPRFLETARKIREDIRSILGINKTVEIKDERAIPKTPSEAYKELDGLFKKFGIAMPNELANEFKGS